MEQWRGSRAVHAVIGEGRRGTEGPSVPRNVTAVMRVTRHDAAVSRRNVLRVTSDECDDTSRLFIAHRKAADRWASTHSLGIESSLSPRWDGMVNGITRDISRTIGTSWIILLTRQLRFNDRYRILMTNIVPERLQTHALSRYARVIFANVKSLYVARHKRRLFSLIFSEFYSTLPFDVLYSLVRLSMI